MPKPKYMNIKKKDIEGKYFVHVEAGKSEKLEDLMLFGKTLGENAKDMADGKLTADELMNEWFKRYSMDMIDMVSEG